MYNQQDFFPDIVDKKKYMLDLMLFTFLKQHFFLKQPFGSLQGRRKLLYGGWGLVKMLHDDRKTQKLTLIKTT